MTKIKLNTKVNDDNNNNFYDTRSNCSTSETDCSSLSSSDKENDSRPSSSLYGSIKPESQIKNINENFQYKTLNGAVVKSVVPPGKGIKVDYYKVSDFLCCFMLFFHPIFTFFVSYFLLLTCICYNLMFLYSTRQWELLGCITQRGCHGSHKFISNFFLLKVPNMAGPKPFSYTQAPQSMAGPPMAAPKSPSSYPPAQPAWAPSAVNAAPKPIGQQNVQGVY